MVTRDHKSNDLHNAIVRPKTRAKRVLKPRIIVPAPIADQYSNATQAADVGAKRRKLDERSTRTNMVGVSHRDRRTFFGATFGVLLAPFFPKSIYVDEIVYGESVKAHIPKNLCFGDFVPAYPFRIIPMSEYLMEITR